MNLDNNRKLGILLLSVTFLSLFFMGFMSEIGDNREGNFIVNNEDNIGMIRTSAFVENPSLFNITWGYPTYSDRGYGIVLDDSDNIYITGYYEDSGSDQEGFLVKYNSSGLQEWNATWGDSSNNDYGFDIALDTSGDIYVVGSAHNATTGNDLFLAKYDSNTGIQQWNTTWADIERVYGLDLVVNSSGDIYVAGYIGMIGFERDALIVKFNSIGIQQWNFTWDGSDEDVAESIELDNSGNIYITGITEKFDSDGDAFIGKFNSSGHSIMNITWGTSNNYDKAYSIDLDASENLYITGQSRSFSSTHDVFLAKFNSAGIQQWNSSWDGNTDTDSGRDIILDASGNIFITGMSFYIGAGEREAFVANYNCTTGVQKWVATWGGVDYDWARDIAIDDSGYIYITGETWSIGAGANDAFIAKLSQNPLGSFELETNTTNPDADGNFLLYWSESINADNYIVYRHSSYINEISNNGTLIANRSGVLNVAINDSSNGDYYFIVYAYNEFFNKSSNCIHIEVQPTNDGTPPGDDNGCWLFILLLIIGSAIAVSVSSAYVFTNRMKKKKLAEKFLPLMLETSQPNLEEKAREKREILNRTIKIPEKSLDIRNLSPIPSNIGASNKLNDIFSEENHILEKIEESGDIKLTLLDSKFLKTVDLFEWEEGEKDLFIRDMLTLTPEKRMKVINEMLKTLKNKDEV